MAITGAAKDIANELQVAMNPIQLPDRNGQPQQPFNLRLAVAGQAGGNCWIGAPDPKANESVCISDTGGSEQEDRLALDTLHFQVMVRNPSYATAEAIVYGIYRHLQSHDGISILDGMNKLQYKYIAFYTNSPPAHLGRDEIGNHLWTLNMRCTRELSEDKANRQ